jgi:hypothetical protein
MTLDSYMQVYITLKIRLSMPGTYGVNQILSELEFSIGRDRTRYHVNTLPVLGSIYDTKLISLDSSLHVV